VIDAVVEGRAANGFAFVRPPGHHAESDRVMGFCLFNNVAAGAAHLRRTHGAGRVLILDWDVHHGNGTQEIFWRDGSVLFVSLHEYPLYPGTGAASERGDGDGEGTTLNVPLSAGGGDAEYAEAMRALVVPAIRRFAPEFVLVSAGFDAHRDDRLANMSVTEAGFAALARTAVDLAAECCDGRLVLVLEGGYALGALRRSAAAVLAELGVAATGQSV
jgi:acetoin utilization deacetylase AcuC-like enzyme